MEQGLIKQINITLDIIRGNFQMNNFMHNMDVFESGKILGEAEQIKINATMEDNHVVDFLSGIIEKLRMAMEDDSVKSEQQIVSFIGIREINSIKNSSIPPYIKSGVQSISNGSKYILFSKLLESLDYEVTTSNYMHVLTAKLK